MKDLNIEPVVPTDEMQLADALQKGLGRAVSWAAKGLWTNKDILLRGCLEDLRYDSQLEESRGDWLWQVMNSVGVVDEFREAILDALANVNDGPAGEQLCELAVAYARQGDARFRLQLRELIIRRPSPTYPTLGEKELISLDGEVGFLFVAKIRGESLVMREWDWEDKYIVDVAITALGEAAVMNQFERHSQNCPAIGRLYDGWQNAKNLDPKQPGKMLHADRMRKIGLNEIIQLAEGDAHGDGVFRGWGMYAVVSDLLAVRERLLSATDPKIIVKYLRVFSNRSLPEFDERLLGLLDHPDERVRFGAFGAVGQNTHPSIRRFALKNLDTQVAEPRFLSLFVRNFQSGDENRILAALRIPDDIEQRHGLLMDIKMILERNSESSSRALAIVVYQLSPCGSCRHDAAKILITRKIAPRWLIEECQNDAVEDTRKLGLGLKLED